MNRQLLRGGYLPQIRGKEAQQEMVGFILIVVLVVIALMVFLILSIGQEEQAESSLQINNMLDAMLDYTTDCAIVFEPQYDSLDELIKSCYSNERCSNLDMMACDYMNTTLR
ncbi:MAG: hypothetical protein ACP5D2_05130, partial [Candidatus Nanoarchaeia archaeon]